jgi:hypothetical protein
VTVTTKVSQIYDALVALVGTTLTGYRRIANPYLVERTASQLVLMKGFGVSVGSGQETESSTGMVRGRERNFNVLLVNQVTALEQDATGHGSIEKALLEDFIALENAIELDLSLGGVCAKVDYTGDSGVQYLSGETGRFISISINFSVLYQETLS